MIIGVDIGYSYTKDSTGNIFRSAYLEGNNLLGGINLEVDGRLYSVGHGIGTVDEDKTGSRINELCLLTSLGLSGYENFIVVSGLPIDQYKTQKELLRTQMLSCGKTFRINGRNRTISITDVVVYPQGIGALHSMDIQEDAIIIDCGGRTTDIAYIEYNGKYNLVKSNTIYSGTMNLNGDIMKSVNQKYSLSLPNYQAEKILIQGLKINGEPQDVTFLSPTIKGFVLPIISELKLNYPCETTKIFLCGGGANILYPAIKNRFKNTVLMRDPQFANAKGFEHIGITLLRGGEKVG
ncbi:MAG: ParM/StbA family protein [Christensenellales bacterium]